MPWLARVDQPALEIDVVRGQLQDSFWPTRCAQLDHNESKDVLPIVATGTRIHQCPDFLQ